MEMKFRSTFSLRCRSQRKKEWEERIKMKRKERNIERLETREECVFEAADHSQDQMGRIR